MHGALAELSSSQLKVSELNQLKMLGARTQFCFTALTAAYRSMLETPMNSLIYFSTI